MTWFLKQKGPSVPGYTKAIFSGLTTLTLAGLIKHLVLEQPELAGLFHVSSAPIDKHALLQKLNAVFLRGLVVAPDEALQVDRSLDSSRLSAHIDWRAPSWDEQLQMLRNWCVPRTPQDVLMRPGPAAQAG